MGKRQKRPVLFAPTIFALYKPAGPSSFSVVSHFKRNLPDGYGKIGHFGTLDPFAQGLLLIGIAGAQKLNDFVHELLPKTYRAIGVLGQKRSTGDLEGEVLDSRAPQKTSELLASWQERATHMRGEYWQSPPAFSAAKHQGKALYEYARAGEMIEKPKVLRHIHDLQVERVFFDQENRLCVEIEATVSSGTYIRSLFEDLAQSMGELGYLEYLLRSQIGHLRADQALKEKSWPDKQSPFDVDASGLSLPQVLPLDQLILNEDQAKKYANGAVLDIAELQLNENPNSAKKQLFWVSDQKTKLLGLGHEDSGQLLTHFNLSLANAVL